MLGVSPSSTSCFFRFLEQLRGGLGVTGKQVEVSLRSSSQSVDRRAAMEKSYNVEMLMIKRENKKYCNIIQEDKITLLSKLKIGLFSALTKRKVRIVFSNKWLIQIKTVGNTLLLQVCLCIQKPQSDIESNLF